MNVVPRKKTRKKNGYFLLGASFIMFGYWYASIMTNNMNTSLSFVPDVVKEQQTENEEDNSNSLALSQSFGFFDTVSNKEWKLLQKITAEHNNHRFPELPLTYNPVFSKSRRKYFNSNPAWWQNNYEPNFSCQFERRIGLNTINNNGNGDGNGDGPKWVCDPHKIAKLAAARKAKDPNHPGCVIYSIGSNGDFSFEMGMQNEIGAGVCEFHIFDIKDYTPKVPKELQRTHFHAWGLAAQDRNATTEPEPGNRFEGLKDTIKLLGHENLDMIDIFKIDCEGCEFETYKDWTGPSIPTLHQIQIEIHDAPPAVINMFDDLEEEGYVRYHKEPNIQFGGGNCIEYGLVKLDKEFFSLRKEVLKRKSEAVLRVEAAKATTVSSV